MEFSHYIVPGTGGHGRARTDALLAVTRVFGCPVAVYGYDAARHDKFLIMAGPRPVLNALDLLLPVVERQMERAARGAAGAYGKEARAALPQMTRAKRRGAVMVPYSRGYLRGYGHGVAEALRGMRADSIETGGPGLVRYLTDGQARAQEAYERRFPAAGILRTEPAAPASAFLAGRDAGRAAGTEDEHAARHDLVFAML